MISSVLVVYTKRMQELEKGHGSVCDGGSQGEIYHALAFAV